MKKYVKGNIETVKIEKVYKNIPSQLAKNKKTFRYNLIDDDGRKRKYERPIDCSRIFCRNCRKKFLFLL